MSCPSCHLPWPPPPLPLPPPSPPPPQLKEDVDLVAIAGKRTAGYSGSDLSEVCCAAVMHAAQETLRGLRSDDASGGDAAFAQARSQPGVGM
jgi:SpoVK/Ycf46/Vps4 family AAA+-type ATPase